MKHGCEQKSVGNRVHSLDDGPTAESDRVHRLCIRVSSVLIRGSFHCPSSSSLMPHPLVRAAAEPATTTRSLRKCPPSLRPPLSFPPLPRAALTHLDWP